MNNVKNHYVLLPNIYLAGIFGSLSLLNIEANVQKYMLIVIYKDE